MGVGNQVKLRTKEGIIEDMRTKMLFSGLTAGIALILASVVVVSMAGVKDTEPPVIQAPEKLVYQLNHGDCLQEVVYELTVTDNLDPNPVVHCNYPSGYWYPIGYYDVVCTATDNAGNQSAVQFPLIIWGEASGVVFADANQNGVREPNEPGIQGAVVRLINETTGALVGELRTDREGRYQFLQIAPGRYRLIASVGARYTPTTRNPQTFVLPRDCGKQRLFGFRERIEPVQPR